MKIKAEKIKVYKPVLRWFVLERCWRSDKHAQTPRLCSYDRILARCENYSDAARLMKAQFEFSDSATYERIIKEAKDLKIISVQTDAGIEARIVTSRAGNIKPDARMPEKCDALNSGTGAD